MFISGLVEMLLFGPRPFEAPPVWTWLGLSLVVPHLLVSLPDIIADLRTIIADSRTGATDERNPVVTFVSDILATRPLPDTVERYPWALWAWKFSLFAVSTGVASFIVALVVYAVTF